MSELQRVGNGETAIELRGGLSVNPTMAIVLASAIGAGVLTLITLVYARRVGLMDVPSDRRSHAVVTPRGGGLSMVLVVGAGLAYFAITQQVRVAIGALVGLALVAAVGWLDDHKDLSVRVRLLAHFVASILLAASSGLPPWGMALTFVCAIVLINVWNFMDGINGIAASQAAVFAAVSAVLLTSPMAVWLSVLLLGACIGFLPFNFPRARIFMGDVGSGALGFLIAVLLSFGMRETHGILPIWLLAFPLAPFLVDAGWTLLARILKREAWWTAHVTHVYQVWSRRLGAHLPVTLAYLVLALLGAGLAISIQGRDINFIKISLTLWYTVLSFAWWILRKQGFTRSF